MAIRWPWTKRVEIAHQETLAAAEETDRVTKVLIGRAERALQEAKFQREQDYFSDAIRDLVRNSRRA